MKRVQVQLTDDQLDTLKRHADGSGVAVSAQVRKAVDAWIANEDRQAKIQRALEAIGGFHSGLGDVAERHDYYLAEGDG